MAIDRINQSTWSGRVVGWFETHSGWTDPGEERLVGGIADQLQGAAILDLGVGGGRTIPLMRQYSDHYIGIDFSQAMVDACHRRYPDATVYCSDARDLSRFATGSFDFVMFSWNGIDAVNHDDRSQVLDEVRRVLTPDGLFLFSTLNQDGPGARERPWRFRLGELKSPRTLARRIVSLPVSLRNYLRHRSHESAGDGWSLRVLSAHEYGIVAHFAQHDYELREIAAHGYELVEARTNTTGAEPNDGADLSDVYWIHYLVRPRANAENDR